MSEIMSCQTCSFTRMGNSFPEKDFPTDLNFSRIAEEKSVIARADSSAVNRDAVTFRKPVDIKRKKDVKRPETKPAPTNTPGYNINSLVRNKLQIPTILIRLGIRAVRNFSERITHLGSNNRTMNLFEMNIRLNKSVHIRNTKFTLKYSLYEHRNKICLIVNDDMEHDIHFRSDITVEKYLHLLRTHDLTYIRHVITVAQLQRFYFHEGQKKKLRGSFDLFLVDIEISEFVAKYMGKKFTSKARAVRLSNIIKFGRTIDKALHRVICSKTNKYNMRIEVANDEMSETEIIENIATILRQFKEAFGFSFRKILEAVHIIPKGYPLFSFPLLYLTKSEHKILIMYQEQDLLDEQELQKYVRHRKQQLKREQLEQQIQEQLHRQLQHRLQHFQPHSVGEHSRAAVNYCNKFITNAKNEGRKDQL